MDSNVMAVSEIPPLLGADSGLLLGDLLIQRRLITSEDLKAALAEPRNTGERVGEVLLRLEIVDDLTLTNTLAEHLGIERADLEDLTIEGTYRTLDGGSTYLHGTIVNTSTSTIHRALAPRVAELWKILRIAQTSASNTSIPNRPPTSIANLPGVVVRVWRHDNPAGPECKP